MTATAPLTAILAAFAAGETSLRGIADRTALAPTVVEAGVEQLVRLGHLRSEAVSAGCPATGCGGCPSGRGDAPGCGTAAGPASRGGATLVALTLARRA